MIKDIKTHFWHYAILILIILVSGIAFFSSSDKTVKFQVGVLAAFAYVFWGFFHHFLEDNLNVKIMVEYILIGALSVVLLGGILL